MQSVKTRERKRPWASLFTAKINTRQPADRTPNCPGKI